ncbi:transcriptional regulator [Desulfuromonas versatilis]|uniref:Transcriptional regulator n=1 Tax=Desulfuromonas versatilis TaxID=2802975 RepID=A0ABN6DW39_9BACT|nr:LysR family transcriptional regulator [Desulfuromonas versatilis]BCR04333.1 transcriptional regulator [Desulfuromonas versatilis]
MNQNWDDMRYFLALSRAGSFVAAAGHLRVTHSTVARRISALETTLQTQLFLRTEKGCRLTPAGEKLLPYAEQLESTVFNLEAQISGKDHQLTGAVRIGAPDGLGNRFLASRLGRFQSRHPALDIELIAVPMYYSLSKREIDILITVTKPTVGNVVARKLIDYRLGLFSTREYLQRGAQIRQREDLRGHRLIGYIDDLLYDQGLRFMDEFLPGAMTRFRSSTVVAQMHAVAGGAGIGAIPYFMAAADPALVPVLPDQYVERGFWLQVNPDSRQLARVRTTIDFIVQEIESSRALFQSLPGENLG